VRETAPPPVALPLTAIGASTLLSAFCVWWLYFDVLDGRPVTVDGAHPFRWGHGHLLAFCAIGAMGAAAEVAVQAQTEGLAFALPLRLAVVLPAALTVLALAWIRSVTARTTTAGTATRVLAATAILVGGLWAGASGPVAATVVVAAVLTLQAAFETIAQGLRIRRA
jgi:low temperature requirement protein LtrA